MNLLIKKIFMTSHISTLNTKRALNMSWNYYLIIQISFQSLINHWFLLKLQQNIIIYKTQILESMTMKMQLIWKYY